jgi:enamine deaminase RidA (YjgF/YER057c/UK114 family)
MRFLASIGSHKSRLLLGQIFLHDTADFDEMNRAWIAWMQGIAPPARVTVGASFAVPDIRVEVQFTAAVGNRIAPRATS